MKISLFRLTMSKWKEILCSKEELNLGVTLLSGQSFRWHKTEDGMFEGITGGRKWLLTQTDDSLKYCVTQTAGTDEIQYLGCPTDDEEYLSQYFQLGVDMTSLCKKWTSEHPQFSLALEKAGMIRVLKQDPVEAVFAFICSTNNNISRITRMCERLCTLYGVKISPDFCLFPTVASLAAVPTLEKQLRKDGFGYRAAYIQKAAEYIHSAAVYNHSDEGLWIYGLEYLDLKLARDELLMIPGVGPKVADCILLMSLNKPSVVPIDTHIKRVIVEQYSNNSSEFKCIAKSKSLTNTMYQQLSQYMTQLFGEYAGWAQAILFAAEVKKIEDNKKKK